ncbi:MAG: hypothetical protein ACRDLZ_03090 [Gaiellaceae bacterium]
MAQRRPLRQRPEQPCREAADERTSVSVASARSFTGSLPMPSSSRPRTGPTRRPADVKKLATVTYERSRRRENAANASSRSAMVAIDGEDEHWVCGDRGVSRWLLTGSTNEGEQVRVHGCDLFDLADDGRIRRKDSYWKIVQP